MSREPGIQDHQSQRKEVFVKFEGFRDMLMSLKGEHKVRVVYASEVKMRKKGDNGLRCPFGEVVKIGRYNGVLGKSHHQAEVDAVNAKGTGYVLPIPQGRRWGQHIEGTCLIQNKDDLFIQITEVDELSIEYIVDGLVITQGERLLPWLPKKEEIVSTRAFNLRKINRCQIDDLPEIEVE